MKINAIVLTVASVSAVHAKSLVSYFFSDSACTQRMGLETLNLDLIDAESRESISAKDWNKCEQFENSGFVRGSIVDQVFTSKNIQTLDPSIRLTQSFFRTSNCSDTPVQITGWSMNVMGPYSVKLTACKPDDEKAMIVDDDGKTMSWSLGCMTGADEQTGATQIQCLPEQKAALPNSVSTGSSLIIGILYGAAALVAASLL